MSTFNLSSLKMRILSSMVLIPVASALVIYGSVPFLVFVCGGACVALYEWLGLCEKSERKISLYFLGLVYLIVSFSSLIFLRYGFAHGAWLVLSLAICVWSSDIGAYFFGKFIGGPKLMPNISPNKTWAGLIGAMVSCALSLVVMLKLGEYLAGTIETDLGLTMASIPFLILSGCVFGATGQAGDLFISLFKRHVKIKDTGNIIPGHGGILDRIDSLLLVSPVFLATYALFIL